MRYPLQILGIDPCSRSSALSFACFITLTLVAGFVFSSLSPPQTSPSFHFFQATTFRHPHSFSRPSRSFPKSQALDLPPSSLSSLLITIPFSKAPIQKNQTNTLSKCNSQYSPSQLSLPLSLRSPTRRLSLTRPSHSLHIPLSALKQPPLSTARRPTLELL